MVLVRNCIPERICLRCNPGHLPDRFLLTVWYLQCLDRDRIRSIAVHAVYAVPSGSVQRSEDLRQEICTGCFISNLNLYLKSILKLNLQLRFSPAGAVLKEGKRSVSRYCCGGRYRRILFLCDQKASRSEKVGRMYRRLRRLCWLCRLPSFRPGFEKK